MGEVVTLHGRCLDCRKPLAKKANTIFQRLCSACFDQAVSFMAEERKLFELLLACGVSRETANVMMIAKHEHEDRKKGTKL